MKTTIFMVLIPDFGKNPTSQYLIGALLALIILGYLLYSLIKPENF
jgi:K+-transporting ATPase KdpF subunit